MGIVFVLIVYFLAGGTLSALGAAVFGGSAAFLTRGAKKGRRAVIVMSVLFPFACGAWTFSIFVAQAIVNETVLDRDMDLGDTLHCPLPNGDQIMMVDVTDQGWVYNPKTQPGGVGDQHDAVSGVRRLQVSGRYVFGAADSNAFNDQVSNTDRVDSYFLLDTQAGKHTSYPTKEALQAAAQALGIRLQLEPIYSIYSRYRFTWFDWLALCAMLGGPVVGAVALIRRIARVRKTRDGREAGAAEKPIRAT